MLYTLSFNLKFKHSNDTVYLAHCYPYTYSTLQNYLRELEVPFMMIMLLETMLRCLVETIFESYNLIHTNVKIFQEDNFKSQLLTVRLLARSLAGNNVYVVTVTSPDNYLEESVKVCPLQWNRMT